MGLVKASEHHDLLIPVTVQGVTYTELDMRRSKARDLMAAADENGVLGAAGEIRLFANLCEVVPDVIEELDAIDYSELQRIYAGFLDPNKLYQPEAETAAEAEPAATASPEPKLSSSPALPTPASQTYGAPLPSPPTPSTPPSES